MARLETYGEVYREKVGDHTVVVRGIFHQRTGDSYHVRVLKGAGKASDEKKRGNVLFKEDFYINALGVQRALSEAIGAGTAQARDRTKPKPKPAVAMGATVKDGTGKKWGARRVGSGISYYEWQPESLPHSSGGRTWTNPAKWERADPYYMPAGVESALDRLLEGAPKAKAKAKAKPTLKTGLTIRLKNPEERFGTGLWKVEKVAKGVPGSGATPWRGESFRRDVWEIRSETRGDSRILGETEFRKFWEIVPTAKKATKKKATKKATVKGAEIDVGALAPECARPHGLEVKKASKHGFVLCYPGSKRTFHVSRSAGQAGWYTVSVGGPGSARDFKKNEIFMQAPSAKELGEIACRRLPQIMPWLSDPAAFYASAKKATKKKATKKKARDPRYGKVKPPAKDPTRIYISGPGSDFKAVVKWAGNGVGSVQFERDGKVIGSATYGLRHRRWALAFKPDGGRDLPARVRELMEHWIEVSAREGLTEVRQVLDSSGESTEIRTRPASKHNDFGRLKTSPAAKSMDARIAKYTERGYTRDEAQILIEAASKWLEYGPDYDRNIASAAADVVDALVRNQGVSTFSGILALRLADKGLLPLLRLPKATKKKATKKKATRKKAPSRTPRAGASDKYPRVRIDYSNSEADTPKGKRTVEEFDQWMAAEAGMKSASGGYTKTWPKIYIDGKREPFLEMRVDVDYYRKEGTTFLEILHQRVQYNTRMLEKEPTGRVAENRREMLPLWQVVLDALEGSGPARRKATKSRGAAFDKIVRTVKTAGRAEFRRGNRRWIVGRDQAAPGGEPWVRMTGDGAYIQYFSTVEEAVESVFAMATKKKATKKATKKKVVKKATKKKATKKKVVKKATKKKTRNRAAEGRAARANKKNVRKRAKVPKKKVSPRRKRTPAEEARILRAWQRGDGSV